MTFPNRFLTILILICSGIFLQGQSILPPGFEEEEINGLTEGKLASLEEEGWNNEGRFYFRRVTYDLRGLPLEEEFRKDDDSPELLISYDYDSQGRRVKKAFRYPDHPHVWVYENYLWEKDALASVGRIFTTGKFGWRYEYSYDQVGRLSTARKYDRYWKDLVVWTKRFTYDELGRIREISGGGLDENLQWREEFDYIDDREKPREKRRWDADGILDSITLYGYDEGGLLLSEKDVSPGGHSRGEVIFWYRHDEWGNWTEKLVGSSVSQGRDYFNPASWYIRRYAYRD